MSEITISTVDQLRTALLDPTPGRVVNIAPGIYERATGGFGSNPGILRGAPDAPIVFRNLEPNNRPEIRGGMYLPGMANVTFDGLHLTRPVGHNVNADDSDNRDACGNIRWLNCHFESLPHLTGLANIKATRLDDIIIRGCRFEGYGDEAIDTVGVHGGVISGCDFIGVTGFSQRMAVQLKGGTWGFEVFDNLLLDAGNRGIQAGGGSSEENSRPRSPRFECERANIHDNIIVGGDASFVLSTQKDCRFHHNLCHLPVKWVCRLLQENGFSDPNRSGVIDHNLITFRGSIQPSFVNQGGTWEPETFSVHDNAYWQVDGDNPAFPRWPGGIVDIDMIRYVDPLLIGTGRTLRITSSDPRFIDIGPARGGPTMTTWSIVAGATPPGISLNPITGAISGIPAVAGVSTFTVRGSGDTGTAVRQYTVTIEAVVVAVVVSPNTLPDGRVGEAYNAQLSLRTQ